MLSRNTLPLQISDPSFDKLRKFVELLRTWNTKHNIISAADLPDVWERHVYDSLMAFAEVKTHDAKRWVDIGSGTGFPLIPLGICNPEIKFLGIEPREKRNLILRHFFRELKIENIELFCGRAEDYQGHADFDVASARAVGSLADDWKRAQPFLCSGGVFVTYKTQLETLENQKIQSYSYSNKRDYYILSVEKHG